MDDGYQARLGDWLEPSSSFGSLRAVAGEVRDAGRRVGVWTAPFLAVAESRVVAEHPEWFAREVPEHRHWDTDLQVLDVTHPGAAEHLAGVFRTFRDWGISLFKVDFVSAGAMDGRRHEDVSGLEAYRRGLELIRDAVGPESYLLGCGAPVLPSVGLVDAMRVGPDTADVREPASGDLSQPAQRSAETTTAARAFAHGRFWVNDPDCLLVAPSVETRERWADTVARHGGLRASGDRLRDLDGWGLTTTREVLATPPLAVLVDAWTGGAEGSASAGVTRR